MYRPVPTRTRSMILQAQAALLAVVFVASQVGSYLHAATEHHARCPEHGELIHVDAPPAADTAATETAPGTTHDGHALRNGTHGADSHEHDHCYLCSVSRERLGTVPSAETTAPVMAAVVAHAQPAVVAHSGQSRYVIAPKTSPPL